MKLIILINLECGAGGSYDTTLKMTGCAEVKVRNLHFR